MQQISACDYCRYRKRRCDRARPRCSLCEQKDQFCQYTSSHPPWFSGERLQTLVSRPPESQTPGRRHATSDFPNAYFLDHEVFRHNRLSLPTATFRLAPSLCDAIEAPDTIPTMYFSWVHLWMPIVSKRRWHAVHVGPLASPGIGVKLLQFCMKLLMWTPGPDMKDREPRNTDYFVAKQAFLETEQQGAMTLVVLQAMILLAIYEAAHAIYPSAFLTISTCAKYGIALGLEKQRRAEMESKAFNAEEQEERRRVWWAVIVLDRLISHETPTSPDPRPDDLLPLLDQDWDDGNIDESRLCPVSAPSNMNMGMLARLSQAAYLLGRVYRHQKYPTGDSGFDQEERVQLDRSLRALLNLTYEEGSTRFMAICPQIAITFSALIILHSKSASSSLPPMPLEHPHLPAPWSSPASDQYADFVSLNEVLGFLRPIVRESAVQNGLFFRRQPWSIEKSSPLLLHWTYLNATAFLRIRRSLRISLKLTKFPPSDAGYAAKLEEMMQEAEHGLEAMKHKLSLLGRQWCAADAYLRILEARTLGDVP